jgi:hypothetical protein
MAASENDTHLLLRGIQIVGKRKEESKYWTDFSTLIMILYIY